MAEEKSLVTWLKKSLCIPSRIFKINHSSPPYSHSTTLVRLLSAKSCEEAVECFELSPALMTQQKKSSLPATEKGTQTDVIEVKTNDTPKAYSARAKEILASRISSASSSNEIFNRFDVKYKSEIVRGSFSTPRKSLPLNLVQRAAADETPKSTKETADDDDFIEGIQSIDDYYFDDDFSCQELPINLRLVSKFDDQHNTLDMSSFIGFENLFDKTLVDQHEGCEKSLNESSFYDKEPTMKERDSMETFKEYLHICPEVIEF